MGLVAILLLGMLLGVRHAMEADHLAAVATLTTAAGTPRQAAVQGVLWGFGHAVTLLLFAAFVISVGRVIPEAVAVGLELVVAGMLIFLGVDVLCRASRQQWHVHMHAHGRLNAKPHAHAHPHAPPSYQRALAIGIMHGLSGSAALVLLALRETDSRLLSLAYVSVFGLGSMLGMGGLSFAFAVPMRASARRSIASQRALNVAAGLGSLAMGMYMAWTLSRSMLAS